MRHSKLAVFALVAACTGVVFTGCSGESKQDASSQNAEFGEVTMRLTVDGQDISTLDYSIATAAAPAVQVAGGSTDVSVEGATATASAHLAPNDYVVTLTTPDDTTCLGSGSFTVTADGHTTVSLTMTCGSTNGAPVTGSVDIALDGVTILKPCGIVESFAGPTTTSGDITLNSEATAGSSFEWSVSPDFAGTFADSSAAATTFNCDSATPATITLTIADGSCTDSVSYAVECLNALCGNGTVDPGETCATCAADVEASGEICPVCDNGVLEPGEDCSTCVEDVLATGGNCVICGDGDIDAGEDCDTCEADVLAVNGPDACDAPDQSLICNGCINDPASNPDIAGFNAGVCDGDALCEATRACVANTGCFGGLNPSHLCYCGPGISVADCIAPSFTPGGVCAAEMIAGLGTDSPSNQTRLERQFNPGFPAGAAFAILTGSRDVGQCIAECQL